jgi:hypothetical protein
MTAILHTQALILSLCKLAHSAFQARSVHSIVCGRFLSFVIAIRIGIQAFLIADHESGDEFHACSIILYFTYNLCSVGNHGNGRISRFGVPHFIKNGRILFAFAFVLTTYTTTIEYNGYQSR